MTKRDFIKKSITGIASLFFVSALKKTKTVENEPQTTKSDAYNANMAFGHSLPHSEFNGHQMP